MFYRLDFPKVIGDPIHGYIPLTRLEYNVLQLPVVNRLHFIRQTALAYLVFPGSLTTRFSHVVGALHIGGKLVSQLLLNMNEPEFKQLFPEISDPAFVVKAIRLACLLHDVGHGPFSHSAEELMIKITKEKHQEELEEAKKLFNENNENKLPIHEYYSYKLVTNGEIPDIIEEENEGNQLVQAISELLIKMPSKLVENNSGFNLFRKLVSSQLDADRMDYLLRDSTMSGVKFGLVDVDRIINNMKIIKNKIAIHERAIGSIEDMLDARYKMYRWFYGHHTNVGLNELIKMALEKILESNKAISNIFHWSSFGSGRCTDDQILEFLHDGIDNNEIFSRFKGLIDRRYLPVSIFKSVPDQGRLIRKIIEQTGITENDELIRNKIVKFFTDGGERLKKALEEVPDLNECLIFQSTIGMKPYEPFSESDKVYLYRSHEENICELWSESKYFRTINEVWKNYHGLYVYYLIPKKQREEFSKFRGKVFDIITSVIAANY